MHFQAPPQKYDNIGHARFGLWALCLTPVHYTVALFDADNVKNSTEHHRSFFLPVAIRPLECTIIIVSKIPPLLYGEGVITYMDIFHP